MTVKEKLKIIDERLPMGTSLGLKWGVMLGEDLSGYTIGMNRNSERIPRSLLRGVFNYSEA